MEKTTSQKNKIRPFIIVGLLIFILATTSLVISKICLENKWFEAVFTNVNGLQLGNNVRYSE
jgi:phospholipid/cholesterol/gamma-HCH transport system substrate-binding protein